MKSGHDLGFLLNRSKQLKEEPPDEDDEEVAKKRMLQAAYEYRKACCYDVSISPPFPRLPLTEPVVETTPFYTDGLGEGVEQAETSQQDAAQVREFLVKTMGFSEIRVENVMAILGDVEMDQCVSFLMENEAAKELDKRMEDGHLKLLNKVLKMGFTFHDSHAALKKKHWLVDAAIASLLGEASPLILSPVRYSPPYNTSPVDLRRHDYGRDQSGDSWNPTQFQHNIKRRRQYHCSDHDEEEFPWNILEESHLYERRGSLPPQIFVSETAEELFHCALGAETDKFFDLIQQDDVCQGPLDCQGNSAYHYGALGAGAHNESDFMEHLGLEVCETTGWTTPNARGEYPIDFVVTSHQMINPREDLCESTAFLRCLRLTHLASQEDPESLQDDYMLMFWYRAFEEHFNKYISN